MLIYDVADASDFKTKYSTAYSNILKSPHYYVGALKLKSMARQMDTDLKCLSYKDIALPHQNLILTIKDDDEDTVEETALSLKDMGPHIEVLAYFRFTMSGPKDHVFMVAHLHDTDEGDVGTKFTIKTGNLENFFMKDKIGGVENQLSQYIYNALSQFNLVINKNRDLREGIEKRYIKTNKNAKGKKAYSDVTIIHLDSHKYLKQHSYNTKNNVVWNNSWVVRGHWRYFSDKTKLGKNRDEVRGEEGRTWVVPYEKQSHLEFKNKIRQLRV